MEMILVRRGYTETATEGDLFCDGEFECYTLEDAVREPGVKIPGRTAIPEGRYQVVITHSPRFKRELPLLLNVPDFDGIRIHPGNTADDTEGCILVGDEPTLSRDNWVGKSQKAFNRLFVELKKALAREEAVWITIHNGPQVREELEEQQMRRAA